MSNSTKICPHCEKEIPYLATFCPECGERLDDESLTEEDIIIKEAEKAPEVDRKQFDDEMAKRRESYQKQLDQRKKRTRRMVPVVALLAAATIGGGMYAGSRLLNIGALPVIPNETPVVQTAAQTTEEGETVMAAGNEAEASAAVEESAMAAEGAESLESGLAQEAAGNEGSAATQSSAALGASVAGSESLSAVASVSESPSAMAASVAANQTGALPILESNASTGSSAAAGPLTVNGTVSSAEGTAAAAPTAAAGSSVTSESTTAAPLPILESTAAAATTAAPTTAAVETQASRPTTEAAVETQASRPTIAADEGKRMYTSANLNVRSAPSGDKIGSLGVNERIQVLDDSGSWYKVVYNGQTAYVWGEYVKSTLEEAESASRAYQESKKAAAAETTKSSKKNIEETSSKKKSSKGSDDSYIFSTSSKKKLKKSTLESMSKSDLRLARNEIYARHGAIFSSDSLQSYFEGKSWYTPKKKVSSISWSELNDVEQYNVNLIAQYE